MGIEIVLLVIGFLLTLRGLQGYLRTKKDPEWEQRWSQLPQLQREHIAKAVQLAGTILLTFLMKPSPLGLAPILLLLAFLIWVLYRERTTRRNLDRASRVFTP
jgi:uncharacterized membrane protein (UPF0136 family)